MFAQIARALAPVSFAAALAVTPVLSPALADPSEMDAKRLAKPIVEVAFVLDTTGSMGPLIEGAKRKIWSIPRSSTPIRTPKSAWAWSPIATSATNT